MPTDADLAAIHRATADRLVTAAVRYADAVLRLAGDLGPARHELVLAAAAVAEHAAAVGPERLADLWAGTVAGRPAAAARAVGLLVGAAVDLSSDLAARAVAAAVHLAGE